MKCKIAIIGGGIAGLTGAIAFLKAGYSPMVFEAAKPIKPIGAGLGLAANAIKALGRLGIKNKVVARGRVLSSFAIKDETGRDITYNDSTKISREYGLDNFTIHRAALHDVLLSEIPKENLVTGKKAIDFIPAENGRSHQVLFKDGTSCEADYVIVADGIHSAIRQKLIPGSKPRYAGYTCWRAVIDNSRLLVGESYEIWGRKGRFGVVPLADDQLYWFATVNAAENHPRFKNFTLSDLKSWFKDYPDTTKQIIEASGEDALIWNDIIDLKPISRYAFGKLLLVGDAAHATTPNMGQGACQAIEDAAVLLDELTGEDSLEEQFARFEKRRLRRTHFIVNQSARIGKIAQAEHPILIRIRNGLFRAIPESIRNGQLKELYNTDF